jgi:hypothetical protein
MRMTLSLPPFEVGQGQKLLANLNLRYRVK